MMTEIDEFGVLHGLLYEGYIICECVGIDMKDF